MKNPHWEMDSIYWIEVGGKIDGLSLAFNEKRKISGVIEEIDYESGLVKVKVTDEENIEFNVQRYLRTLLLPYIKNSTITYYPPIYTIFTDFLQDLLLKTKKKPQKPPKSSINKNGSLLLIPLKYPLADKTPEFVALVRIASPLNKSGSLFPGIIATMYCSL